MLQAQTYVHRTIKFAQHFAMLSYEVKGNKMLDFVLLCLRLKYLPIFFPT